MRFIIKYDYGYGENYDCVEANNEEEAEQLAYLEWREGAEAQADYGIVGKWTQELEDLYL